ncbi:hypothetical protein [Streptosporangium jomthongense]|uniref:Uncharacterized protein n=1 Tax=Streptosporangium jomthongense TaxID=1193683 RepID=A0ABV8FDQ0_9ACTN
MMMTPTPLAAAAPEAWPQMIPQAFPLWLVRDYRGGRRVEEMVVGWVPSPNDPACWDPVVICYGGLAVVDSVDSPSGEDLDVERWFSVTRTVGEQVKGLPRGVMSPGPQAVPSSRAALVRWGRTLLALVAGPRHPGVPGRGPS